MKPKTCTPCNYARYYTYILLSNPCTNVWNICFAVWITDCLQDNYYNTTGSIGPAGNVFTNSDFGTHTRNSGSLILRGGEVRTFKTPGVANVCSVKMYYRIYLQSGVPGAFNSIDLPLADNCDIPSSQFPSGGACVAGDQKWNKVIPDGASSPSPVLLHLQQVIMY